jgi:hypothetical protein
MLLKKLPHIIFLLSIALTMGIGYVYFFQISPTFVQRPEIENPLSFNGEITFEHITYLLTELEAYKLHNIPFTDEEPIIQVFIYDTNQNFLVKVVNNEFRQTTDFETPDIKIIALKSTLQGFFEGKNEEDIIVEALSKGEIKLELIKDEKTLALKGYKILYDKITSKNEITGGVTIKLSKLNPLGFTRSINLALLVLSSIMIGLILEKEM